MCFVLAGRRALWRGDTRAAASLLERSLVLTRPTRFDIHLEVEFADSLWAVDTPRAVEILERMCRARVLAGPAYYPHNARLRA